MPAADISGAAHHFPSPGHNVRGIHRLHSPLCAMSHRRIGESQRIDNLIDAPDSDILDDCVSGQLADEQGGLGNIVGSELANNIVNAGRSLEAGSGRGGEQAGDAHAIGLQFSVKAFGEVQHAGLGCSVNTPLLPALAGAARGHIDDGAAALLLKDGRKYVCGVDHAVEVQLDGSIDFSLGLIDDILDGNATAASLISTSMRPCFSMMESRASFHMLLCRGRC